MRGAHGDDMLFVNEKVPSQLSSNDSVAYNACSPHHNSLNKPVAKILFPEIKTSKLKGAYSLLMDFTNWSKYCFSGQEQVFVDSKN
ncbi:hypothetical protein YC2023_060012 [Brassica napus]